MLKGELYATLNKDGLTLKDWFVQRAKSYVEDRVQLRLALPTADEGELHP